MDTSGTPYGSVLARLVGDPSSPLVTDVDLGTGDRVELSVSSVANGAAKAAHLVRGLAGDIGRSPRIGLRVPLHWQVVTFALGAWAGGGILVVDGTAAPGRGDDLDALVVGPGEAAAATDDLPEVVWASRLHAFGLPLSPPPTFPVEDLTLALRAEPDEPPADLSRPGEPAVVIDGAVATTADLLARAGELGVGDQDRILTCLPWTSIDAWVVGLVLPSLGRRSVVLVRGAEDVREGPEVLRRLCETEQVTATAGMDVAGLPRLC